MIYVNLNSLRPGQAGFDSTITHEFQHMVHFARCPSQEGWVDEGASELAMRVAGYEGAPPPSFAAHPDVQLNAWSTEPPRPHSPLPGGVPVPALRGRARRRLGRPAQHARRPARAARDCFRRFSTRQPIAPDLDSLFADWTVANLLQDPAVGRRPLRLCQRRLPRRGDRHCRRAGAVSGLGAAIRGQLRRPAHGRRHRHVQRRRGRCRCWRRPPTTAAVWWSNRGDSLDSRLTRQRRPARRQPRRRCSFQAWYDLEDQFDFVYLSASRDGGKTWQVLARPPHHARPGHRQQLRRRLDRVERLEQLGWVDEQVDLTPFAGSDDPAALRVRDRPELQRPGLCPQRRAHPPARSRRARRRRRPWIAEGWVRVDAPVPEHWNLRLVRWTPSGVSVDPVPVDSRRHGHASPLIPQRPAAPWSSRPTAPQTLLPGDYSLAISP